MNNEKRQSYLYLAVDIETTGAELDRPILCFAAVIGTREEGVLKKKTWCFDSPALDCNLETPKEEICKHYEWRAWQEFWKDKLDLLKRIKSQSSSDEINWASFLAFLDGLEEQYPNADVILVSDNPAYDIAALNNELHKRFGRMPMNRTKNGGYRCTHDPYERLVGSSYLTETYKVLDKLTIHDHWSENDATQILAMEFISLDLIDALSASKKDSVLPERLNQILSLKKLFYDKDLKKR